MHPTPYEEIEHTADWALRVRGVTLESLFEHAAQGMLSLLEPGYLDSSPTGRSLELSAIDLETLLVSWLEELLFLIETEKIGFQNYAIRIEGTSLEASFESVPIESIKKDIKAVTYNELEIVHDQEGYRTTIVFDV
ncbi:MAG: archease [Anaerolineales bacterium]|nr:archease [Anaerolineales bacterium]